MLRRGLFAVLVLLAALAAGAVVDLLRIRSDVDAGRDGLDHLTLDTLRDVGIQGALDDAADHLHAARDRADRSPFLAALSPLPVLDDQVEAIRDLSRAADELGGEARTTGARIAAALDRASGDPPARVELLDTVLAELDRMEGVAARTHVGAGGSLLGPLRDARASIQDSLDSVPEKLDPLRDRVRALRDVLAGPSAYLVMVGNNAEMRAGAGMPLQIGVATIGGGDIDLGEFEAATSELYTDHPTGRYNAHLPDALSETYPRWLLGQDFPETAVVPDFPRTAPIYADIADDTQGWETDGAIHIDAIALASLLEVTGPIELYGVEYSSETAPQLVLNQVYLAYADQDQAVRRDAQSDLAQALFDAIEERDIDLLDIVDALQSAAEGRHLMAWSRDPVLEDLFASFGADGTIGPTQTLVSLQNTAANKLDWYIRPSVDVEAEARDDEWLVTLRTTIHHPQRDLTVPYIEGPYLPDGTHRALLTVQVPRFAGDLRLTDATVTESGDDGVSQVIGTRFELPRGQDRTVTAQFTLPRTFGGLAVAPSARVRPVPWTVNGVHYDDGTGFAATFGSFPDRPEHGSWQMFALMGVLVAAAGTATIGNGARRNPTAAGAERLARVDQATGVALLTIGFALAAAAFVLAG